MSDLLRSLSLVTRALEAQRFGLEVTGQNIANVNTPGYTRREAQLAAVRPLHALDAGGGVEVTGVRAARDRLLERRLYNEIPAEQREAAVADALGVVEVALGAPGASLDASITRMFDAFARLAAEPTSPIARQEVVREADALAGDFRDMASRLTRAQHDADASIRSAVSEINGLVGRIASLNEQIGGSSAGETLALQDEQNEAVKALAGLLDVGVLPRTDGGVDLTFGNGRPLAIGANAFAVEIVASAPSGFAEITAGGRTVTAEITSGRLAGLLQVRDALIPEYQSRLDTLAFELASTVNGLHATGFDLAGAAGGALFAISASAAGAASAIAIDPAIGADPSKIAASDTGASAGNGVAKALEALRDAPVAGLSGSTFTDAWAQLVYRAGRDVQAATQEQESRQSIVRQLQALRDAVSGVSLDEEAVSMLKFQRAYEANARYFNAVNETLDVLLQTLSR